MEQEQKLAEWVKEREEEARRKQSVRFPERGFPALSASHAFPMRAHPQWPYPRHVCAYSKRAEIVYMITVPPKHKKFAYAQG